MSSTAEVGADFEARVRRALEAATGLSFVPQVALTPGGHRFDLATQDRTVVVECKAYTFRHGSKIPNAKVEHAKEAIALLETAGPRTRKLLVLKRALRPNGDSLGEYFASSYPLRSVELWELDERERLSRVQSAVGLPYSAAGKAEPDDSPSNVDTRALCWIGDGSNSFTDPITAAETIAANEERATSPLQHWIDLVIDALPGVVGAVAKRAVLADRLDKQKLLTEVVVSELQHHARRIEQFCAESSEFRRYIAENFRALTIDALKKAEETRSNDRIRRIGQILVNSVTANPPAAADVTEELMRTAMHLSDRDVLFLGEIYDAQFRFFDNARGIAAVVQEVQGGVRQLRTNSWPVDRLRNAGFDHADLMAIPAKLVSLGLVQPFEWLDGPPYPHFLLRNGLLFVLYARSHSEKFAE